MPVAITFAFAYILADVISYKLQFNYVIKRFNWKL